MAVAKRCELQVFNTLCSVKINYSYELTIYKEKYNKSKISIRLKWYRKKQGRIHGNPVADGWAGAVPQKPLGIQKCD